MFKDKILKETSPLNIFFVKSGSGGNRLLFRYPYDAIQNNNQDSIILQQQISTEIERIQMRGMIEESDETLCNMFAVHPNLCGQKFEIKINNIRHVGHPMSLLNANASGKGLRSFPNSFTATNQTIESSANDDKFIANVQNSTKLQYTPASTNRDELSSSNVHRMLSHNQNNDVPSDITSFIIVFSLRSSASYDTVNCYYDLSKRLAVALSFEERRCSYLSKEIQTMLGALEDRDMASLDNHGSLSIVSNKDSSNQDGSAIRPNPESVFSIILKKSLLARDMKKVFLSLCTTGIVDIRINRWVSVSFCLPQKVHRLKLITHESMPAIGDKDIERCLLYLRPYHGFLLLQDAKELLDALPIDASPAFIQLIKVANPERNFMDLSVDANLTLKQIYCIVSQLVYWAKVTIIYPICDSNIYAIHPLASTGIQSQLVKDFRTRFPHNKSLPHYLADFSEGASLSQLNNPLLRVEEKANLLNIVTWLLQRRILTQMHKYIFSMATKKQILEIHGNSVNGLGFGIGTDDLKLVLRLLPYFDGKHHIEDVMFFENLERSQLLILCDKFRNILYTCHYEDVAVSQLSPFSK